MLLSLDPKGQSLGSAVSEPVPGTRAETYLRGRAISASLAMPSLRFHPACYYRTDDGERQHWPALLGVVTDTEGAFTGLQRTWLARDGSGKAPVSDPRRAIGHLLGNAVRFGTSIDIMAAGCQSARKRDPGSACKKDPRDHPFVRFSSAILPSRPMRLLSRRAQRRSRTAAFGGRPQGLFLRAVSTTA